MWWWLEARWVFSSDARAARVLVGFARAEAESELELRLAARSSAVLRRRALFLRHALDEARHAQRFFELGRSLEPRGLPRPSTRSEELVERLGETRFIAFVHWGERRGRLKFEAYARALEPRRPELSRVFSEIARDELGHERYTRELLLESGEAAARRALLWVRGWETLRRIRRSGRGVARLSYALLMSALYLALWPLGSWFSRAHPARRGFESSR